MQQLPALEISQETIATVLQLGGQYALPAAALLRPLYAGKQHRMPEGFVQIIAASFFAGITALADNQQPDLAGLIASVAGNTIFMIGLLSFILIYLIQMPYWGLLADAIVGGLVGLVGWGIWVFVLGNTEMRISEIPLSLLGAVENPSFTLAADALSIPVIVVAGAVIFVLLRFALRQIGRVLRVARVFVTLGILAILAAGALFVVQRLMAGV